MFLKADERLSIWIDLYYSVIDATAHDNTKTGIDRGWESLWRSGRVAKRQC
jgi:hypothetical protein